MFENVLHQPRVVEQLRQEILAKELPASLLFYGPSVSAKLTTALETARGLSCRCDGSWTCTCEACRTHRTLDYPWLVLTGPKNLLPEIEAGAGLLELSQTDARRYFLLRAIKKLLKRFDPLLWEGDEPKLKGTAGPLGALQDDLEVLYPGQELPTGAELKTYLDRLRDASRSLAGALSSSGVPISQVRRLSAWARTTTSGAPKFILIENADRMLEGARNALLKILEEPPAGTWFFLLTSQKGAMIPTVLSRLRAFAFVQRIAEQEEQILQGLFQSPPGSWSGLSEYFQTFETQKKGLYDELAKTFFEGLAHPFYPLDEYNKFWADAENLVLFLEALIHRLDTVFPHSLALRERLFRLFQDARYRRETYNLSASLLMETLFYKSRMALSQDRP